MPLTRRHLLLSGLTGATGLAGYAGFARQSGMPPETDPGIEYDPPVSKPRNPAGDDVIFERREDGRRRLGRDLISDRDRLERIEFADGVPAEDAEAAWAFLEETDFSEETIYVSPSGIESCYRYRIQSVSWKPPGRRVEHSYCKELRPPDVNCRADERDAVALLFRLPVAIDYDVRRSGSSGRSSCRGTEREWAVIEWNESTGER